MVHACPTRGTIEGQISAQRAIIERFEAHLWEDGFDVRLLPSVHAAWRRLESLYARLPADPRYAIELRIRSSAADALAGCLASLEEHRRLFAWGAPVSVCVNDDANASAPGALIWEIDDRTRFDLDIAGVDTPQFALNHFAVLNDMFRDPGQTGLTGAPLLSPLDMRPSPPIGPTSTAPDAHDNWRVWRVTEGGALSAKWQHVELPLRRAP